MDGVINLDKPKGMTSQEAVTAVKKILMFKKAGHAGTLDPIATGVLLVCLGGATKLSRFLMDLDKEYVGTLKFGESTDTYDAEGKVIERVETQPFELSQVEEVLERFRGSIRQRPPMYSAIKVSGTPLYKLARKGIDTDRPERDVLIKELDIKSYHFPFLTLRIVCSKGTYIRTLVDDIGRAIGTVAHMTDLRRTCIGKFKDSNAALPEELSTKQGSIISADEAIEHFDEVLLSKDDYNLARNGSAIGLKNSGTLKNGQYIRLKGPDRRLFAVGVVSGDSIRIERILHLQKH
jgi:tRNA pseudouridine55 synthase